MKITTPKPLSLFRIFSLFFLALLSGSALAQSTAVNNAPPTNYDATYAVQYIRHETDAQTQILLPFTAGTPLPGAITCLSAVTCAVNWSVTVGGAPVAVNSVVGAAGATQATITLASAIGIAKTVLVSYSGSASLNAFTNRQSYNARPVACGDFSFAAWKDASAACAPVTPESQMIFNVLPGARNSQRWNFAQTTARVTWITAGANPATHLQGKETDNGGSPTTNTNYYVGFSTPDWLPTSNPASKYTYPAADPVCGYTSNWNIRLQYTAPNGTNANCLQTSASQTQSFASYNNDNTGINGSGTAALVMPPSVTNSNLVCLGNNADMQFTDNTRLNCNPFVAPAPANDKIRWVRVVYGSQDLGAGPTAGKNIPNVKVGGPTGTTVTDAGGNLLFPGGYSPTSPATTTFGNPDAFGVVQINAPVNSARGLLERIITTSAVGQAVGQRFWVRLDYWNTCNAYDGVGDAVNNNKRSVSNYIEIVSIPPAATAGTAAAVCNGNTPAAFNITGATANSTVKWYRNVTGASPAVPGTVGTLITTSTASATGTASLAVTSAFSGFNNTVADNYIIWATYTASPGGIACESPPVAITRSVREALTNTNMAIKNPAAVCPGSSVTFVMERPAGTTFTLPTLGVGGATELNWTVPASVGTITSGQGTNTITVTLAATSGSGQVTADYRFTTTPNCPTTITGSTYTMLAPPAIGNSGSDRTICESTNTTFTVSSVTGSGILGYQWQVDTGSGFNNITNGGVYSGATTATLNITNTPFSMNGYKYRVVVTATSGGCSPAATSTFKTLTVQRKPAVTVDPPDRLICIGTNTTFTVTAIGAGTLTYQWQVDTGSGFNNISNGGVYGGATTATLSVTAAPATMNGYSYRVVVTSSACNPPATSNAGVLTMQGPTTAITTPSPSAICAANDLQLNATESFLNGNFTSRAWSGTYKDPALPIATLTNAQLDALLTDGSGGSRRTALDPIFNSAGLGANKIGQYVLTLTTTDDNSCSTTATITINVSQLDANILYGPTAGTATQTDRDAKVCSSYDLFLDGNPSGGSGTFNNDTWTKVSGPAGSGAINTLLNNASTRKPVFNATITGTYVLRYSVQDASGAGCTYTTSLTKDITITVNPLPTASNQTPTVCSDPATPTKATVNLTSLNNAINAGPGVTISWFTAYNTTTRVFSGAIASPTAYVVTNATPVYAQVVTTATGCPFPATVTYTVNPAPIGSSPTLTSACTPSTINIDIFNTAVATAAGGNNVSSTYSWTLALNGLTTAMATSGTTSTLAGTLTNPTNTVRNAVFTVTPTSVLGTCPGNAFTITVPINPVPAIADRTAQICSGTAFGITPANANPTTATIVPAGTTYTWVVTPNANVTGASDQAVGQTSIGQTLTNITNTSQVVHYTVTPKAAAAVGGCTGAPFSVDVTVDPTPKIPNFTPAVCSGTAFSVTPVNNPTTVIVPAGTTYTWTNPVVTGGITGGSAQSVGQTSISQTLVNNSTSPQTATYTVKPKSGASGACVGPDFTITVTVNPIPKLSSNLTPSGICSGTFNYTPTSLTSGATFAWSRPNIPGINEGASSGTGNISETLTNPTTLPVDVTYTIITTANSCPNAGQDVVVKVNPTPLANPIKGPANVCVSTLPVFYSVEQKAGSTYSWQVPAGFTVEAAGGGDATPGGPYGSFTSDYFILLKFTSPTPPGGLPLRVIEQSGDGCKGAVNELIIVAAASPPTVPISGGNVFCKGQKGVVFSVPQNNSSTFTWSVSSGAHFDGPSAGTNLYQVIVDFDNNIPTAQIDVTETNLTGCPANYPSLVVSLLDEPKFTGGTTASICSGEQPSSAYDLNSHITVASNFSWVVTKVTGTVTGVNLNDSGTGQLEHLPTIKNVSGTNAEIEYTVTATASSPPSCKSTPTVIKITVKPEPVMTPIGPQTACPGTFVNGAVSFPFTSNVSGASFNWTNSDPTIGLAASSGTGNISFTAAANLTGAGIPSTITATATANGCTSSVANSVSFVFTLKPSPVITSALPDIIVCPGDQIGPINFAANTGGGETFDWTNTQVLIGLNGSGSGNIAAYPAPNNLTGSDRIATISVTGKKDGCDGTAKTFRIIIHSKPAGTAATRAAQCSNVPFSVSADAITNGMGATSTYTWVRNALPVGLTVVTPGTNTGNIAETLRNLSGTTLSASYNVTPTSGDGCPGDPYVVTIPINSEPVGADITRATQCSNVAFSVSADNIGNGMGASSTYTWVRNTLPAGLTQVTAGSGSGAIAETLQNLTGGTLNATYTVTPRSSAGCNGDTYVVTVPVAPEPVGAPATRAPQCSSVAFSVSADGITNGVTGATFTWVRNTLPAGLTVATAGTGSGPIAETLKNTTAGQLSATYTVTPSVGGCTGATYVITVPVNPEPVGGPVTRTAQCSSVAFSVSADAISNGVTGSTFTWTRNTLPAGLGLVTPGSGTGAIAETLKNTTGGALNATYTVVPTSGAGCVGASYVVTVPINPEPVGANMTATAQCSNAAFSIDPNNITNGLGLTSTYTWVRNTLPAGLTQVTAGTGTGMIAEKLQNLTSSQLSAVYVVTPTSASSCVGATYNVTVPINPEPVGADVTRAAQCSNLSFSVSAVNISNGLGATSTYTWVRNTLPAGLVLVTPGTGTGSTITETLRNQTGGQLTASYVVTPRSADGCVGATYVVSVPIDSEPVGADATRPAECSSVGFNVNPDAITNGMGASSTYTWVRQTLPAGLTVAVPGTGSGTISETLKNTTSSQLSAKYTVTPRSASGCNGPTYVITIPINPEPVGANITRDAQCSGIAFSVSADNITNGLGSTSTFAWSRNPLSSGLTVLAAGTGTGNISERIQNLTAGQLSASYTVIATSAQGCASATYIITVPINPEPVGAATTRAAQCSNVPFSVSADNITNGLGATSTYTWTRDVLPAGLTQVTPGSGNGLIAETLRNLTSGTLNAVYTVTATSAAGCVGATYKITVPVNPEPVGANATRPAQCSDVAFSLSPDNITNGVIGTTFTWVRQTLPAGLTVLSGGTGSGQIEETLRNRTGGTLNAVYRVTPSVGGCTGATYDITVPVNPEPVGANITRTAQCSNVAFSVSANNITNGVAGVTFVWTRQTLPPGLTEKVAGTGVGNIAETLENLTSVQLNAVYTVTPTSGASCEGGSYIVTVPINPEPVGADVTRPGQCSNVAFNLSADNITNGLGATSSYTWTRNTLPAGITVVTPGSGIGNIAETLKNLTGGTLNATYTVTPRSSANCVGKTYVITVPISPEPVGADITRTAECSNVAFSVSADNIQNGVTGTTFTWVRQTLPAGLTQVTAGSGSGAIAETLRNLTSAPLDAKYTVTPTTGGCVGATYVVTIPVNPEPVGSDATRATQCSNVAYSVSPDNIGNGVTGNTFTWVRDNLPVGLSVVTAGTGSGAIAENIRNITSGLLNVTYKVTPTSGAGCKGAVYTITVPINPEPVGANVTRTAQCSDVAFSIDPNNITNGLGASTSFTWTRDPLPAGLTQVTGGTGTGMINERLKNVTSGQLSAVYKVTPRTTAGCYGDVYIVTVPISPEPVGVDVTRANQCSNVAYSVSAISISNNLGSTSTYTWVRNTLPAGLTAIASGTGNGPTINETMANVTGGTLNATYTVTPKSADGCLGTPYVVTVPIDSEPVGIDATRTAECSGVMFSVSANTITNGMGASSSYTWVRNTLPGGLTVVVSGSGTGPISEMLRNTTGGQLNAQYTVTPRSSSGCVGVTYVITIPINPQPLGSDVTRAAQCSNVAFNVSPANIANGLGATSTYTWVRQPLPGGLTEVLGGTGTGDIKETLRNLTGNQLVASYVVTPTSAAGCQGGSYTVFVPIDSEPVGVDVTRAQQCSNVAFSVSPNSITNGMGGTSTYTWVRQTLPAGLTEVIGGTGNGNIAETLANVSSGQLSAVYRVTPKGANGCFGDPYNVTVPVNPEPVGANTTRPSQCSDSPFDLSADNITNGVTGVTFTWVRQPLPGGLVEVTPGNGVGNIKETLKNTTGTTLNAVYRVTPTAGVCPGNTYDITVPINGEPVVANNLNQDRCSDTPYGRVLDTNGTSEPASSYDIEVVSIASGLTGSRTVGMIGTNLPANTIQNDFFTNHTSAALKVVYRVTPKGAVCNGDPKLIEFTVHPEPVLDVPAPPAICSGSKVNITLSTAGTSISAAKYRLVSIEYSNGGPFGTAAPAFFTVPGTNQVAGAEGNAALISNDQFKNIGAPTVTVRYTIVPITSANAGSGTGCEGDPTYVSIDVRPEPDLANALSPAAVCSGLTIVSGNAGYQLRSESTSVVATTFIIRSITNLAGLTAGPSNTGTGNGKPSTAINNDIWINTSATAQTVTYTIAPVSAAGCIGADEDIVVTINPSPAVKANLDRIVCDGAVSGIVLQDNSPTSIAASSYDLISVMVGASNIAPGATVGGLTANASNAATGITTNVNRITNDKFVNNTDNRITVSYTVVAISAAGCRGPQKVITLIVEPPIKSVSVNTTPTICSGDAVNITFATPTYGNMDPTNPIVTFSYSTLASSITGATVGNNLAVGDKITDVLVNTTDNPITVHYRITPRAAAASNGIGCTGAVEDVAVVVQPKPRINNIAGKSVCEGVPVNLSLVSTTNPIAGGTIKIFVTATADAEITGFSNNVLFNNNSMITDALQNSASVAKQVTYHLEVRTVDSGNATICTAGTPVDVVVMVTPTPVITPIADFAICSGTPFEPTTKILTDTDESMTSISWKVTPNNDVGGESNGAGNEFSQTLINNTNNKQTVRYEITATNISAIPSCASNPTVLNVTVYPNPKVVGLPTRMDVCNNGTLDPNPYVLTPSTVAALGTTFDWVFDDGTNPTSNPTNQTAINQTFVNPSTIQSVQTFTIDAHLTIPAGENPKYGNTCMNQSPTTLFVNVAPQVGGDIYGFDLDGNPTTDVYSCKGSQSRVVLEPSGLPNFTVDYSITNSSGTTNLSYTGAGGKPLPANLTETTTYLLKRVTDKFNCHIDINKSVVVHVDAVDVSLAVDGDVIHCSPFDAKFKFNEVAGVEYTWHWGDGIDDAPVIAGSTTPGKVVTHQYTSGSTSPTKNSDYTITFDASLDATKFLNGCRKTATGAKISVYPIVLPAVSPDKVAICSDDLVRFTNTTLGATTNHWYYVDQTNPTVVLGESFIASPNFQMSNTTSQNPAHYDVFYESGNGHCNGPVQQYTISVYRGVDAHFDHTTPTLYMAGESDVTFTNNSVPVDNMFRYEWNFGQDSNPGTKTTDGSVTSIPVAYKHPGTKTVVLTAINIAAEGVGLTCSDDFSATFKIEPPLLVADFDVVPTEACFPTNIKVTANRATGDTWEWTLYDNAGKAAESNLKTPTFKVPAPGRYTLALTTTNIYLDPGDPNYQKSTQKDVVIYDLPIASFQYRPGVVFVPDTELFAYSSSEGATSYLWDFDDGTTSEDKDPVHTYKIENVYNLMLIAKNDHGNGVVCADTVVRKITAKQGGITRVPNAFTPSPNGPTSSIGGAPGANSFNDVFLPQVKGAEEFNMQIFDRWGNLIFESNNSNIGWDGYNKDGKLLPAGVYVYKLTLRLSDGQRTTQVGDITMIR